MTPPKKTPYIAETFAVAGASGRRHTLRYWKIDSTEGRHVNKDAAGTLTFADTGEVLTRL